MEKISQDGGSHGVKGFGNDSLWRENAFVIPSTFGQGTGVLF